MTPEEFIQDRYDLNSEQLDDWRDQMRKLRGFDFENIIDLMESYSVEFAKLHVEAALKEAIGEAPIHVSEGIRNCYPLTNIK